MIDLKFLFASAMVLGLSSACTQEADTLSEIVLAVEDETIDAQVSTKATAVTAIPSSLYFSMTTGTWGNETGKYASSSKSVSEGKIATGIFQTQTPTSYNYYVSSLPIAFAKEGSTIAASNAADVIAGKVNSSGTTPAVELGHVFARTGSLTLNTQDGYNLSGISWKIQSGTGGGTSGTYNIATGAWSAPVALSQCALTSSSDLYLIPGNYVLEVSYTLTKGDWSAAFTKKANVALKGGCVNNISATAIGGSASEISIAVTLAPWGSNPITATFN